MHLVIARLLDGSNLKRQHQACYMPVAVWNLSAEYQNP